MTDKNESIAQKKCITHEFRVSWPAVFTPKAFEDQGERYSVTMIFDESKKFKTPAGKQKNSLAICIERAAAEKWGKDKAKWPKNLKMPIRDGAEKEGTDGYGEGTWFAAANSKTQPGLVGPDREEILNERDFYAGCYARAEVIACAFDQKGNRGVKLSLQNIQKTRDGDEFSGRRDASSVFGDGEEESDDDGPGF